MRNIRNLFSFFSKKNPVNSSRLLTREDIVINYEELQEKYPDFCQYLKREGIEVIDPYFPFNKSTGQIYRIWNRISIIEADKLMNEKGNGSIEFHKRNAASIMRKINKNPDEEYFMYATNGCKLEELQLLFSSAASLIKEVGIGKHFTLSDLIKDIEKIPNCYIIKNISIQPVLFGTAEEIHNGEGAQKEYVTFQLLFSDIEKIQEIFIQHEEAKYIIKLKKFTFDTVMQKTADVIKELPISDDLRERLCMEGSLEPKEIKLIYNIIFKNFLSFDPFEREMERMLMNYLRLYLVKTSNQVKAVINRINKEEYFASPEEYEKIRNTLQNNIDLIKESSVIISPLAFHYKQFLQLSSVNNGGAGLEIHNMEEQETKNAFALTTSNNFEKQKSSPSLSALSSQSRY